MNKIFIIIPTFNHIEKLSEICQQILNKSWHCIVVDDASHTNIKQSLLGLKVHYLRHSENLGQGASLQTGTEYAIIQNAEIIAHFDADGQHHIEDLEVMINLLKMQKINIVLGSRFLDKKHIENIPQRRKTLLIWARKFNNMLTGIKLTDAHNGLRVLDKKAFNLIEIKQNRMAHATETIQKVRKYNLSYQEFATNISYDTHNHQTKSIAYVLEILWDISYEKMKAYVLLLLSFILILLLFFSESFITYFLYIPFYLISISLYFFYEKHLDSLRKQTQKMRKKALESVEILA